MSRWRLVARHLGDQPVEPAHLGGLPDHLVEVVVPSHSERSPARTSAKLGRFELAQGGTLFLDEIGALRPEMQAKLLRVLQEREIERVGGTHTGQARPAYHRRHQYRTSKQAVAGQAFREDLYYRLNVVLITMPPLRERRDDIGALADHFRPPLSPAVRQAGRGGRPGRLGGAGRLLLAGQCPRAPECHPSAAWRSATAP